MIYWKKKFIIYIPKSNENLRYEKSILCILLLATKVFPFINHVFEFISSKNWSSKCYSIKTFKYFSFEINLTF